MIVSHSEVVSYGLILSRRNVNRVVPVAAQAFGNQPGIAPVSLDAFPLL